MTHSLLCETVNGRTMAELLDRRDAVALADMIEVRLDGVADLDVSGALHRRRLPVIATCRPIWEGGRFDGDEKHRAAILAQAVDLGAEFVDVEWRALAGPAGSDFTGLLTRTPQRIVLSMHDFEGVPSDLGDVVRAMRATGAGVIKIAVAAARLTDTLPLIDIARGGDAVVIGMGDAGMPSRLLATRYGSRWTYGGNALAPGQIPGERMVGEFRFRRVGPATRIYGVAGSNAPHSLSPVMHNAAFYEAGIDAVYVPLRAAEFRDFLSYADAMGIAGASVTIPFKLDALQAAAQADERTRAVGAANTLRRIDGARWEATNTDVEGFLAPLEAVFPRTLHGVHASVLGAGGSARAVVVALASRGAKLTVHARRADQAAGLGGAAGAEVGPWPPAAGTWDLLVNCTPLGGPDRRDESPLPGGPFTGPVVYDLTYGPGRSRLLREAAAAGCVTLDGLPMLVAQAERQFEWWTGQRPRAGVMADAARRRLAAVDPPVVKVH
jgi:3-dehydroquinate dehydratase/shikimate dehydrogenase